MSLNDFSLGGARPSEEPTLSRKDQKKVNFAHLDLLNQAELITLREEVDKRLVNTDLKDVNVVKELLLSLKKAKLLQADIEDEDSVPANQKAQVQNSLASIITAVAKLQNTVYDSERFKVVEKALIEALKTMPKDARAVFLSHYSDLAEKGLADELPQ